jgi:hypothetical protein
MTLAVDQDVKEVLEFMQRRFAAARLCSVAAGVAQIAPILWGRYEGEPIDPLRLEEENSTKQLVATG